jgi:riboflavin kinase
MTKMIIHGSISSGFGEGKQFVSLSGYREQFEDKLGYAPFPGTLNVDIDDRSNRTELEACEEIRIEEWEGDDRTYGAVSCYPASISVDGRRFDTAHALVPHRTRHGEEKLEILAPIKLREELEVSDDDRVKIEVSIQ